MKKIIHIPVCHRASLAGIILRRKDDMGYLSHPIPFAVADCILTNELKQQELRPVPICR